MPKRPELPEEAVEALAKATAARTLNERLEARMPGKSWENMGDYERTKRIAAARDDLQAAAPAIRKQERERVLEGLAQHVIEWALWSCGKRTTTEGCEELRRLIATVDSPADTDDLCTCGHVRHEHHTWNEDASVGCAHCGCEQFHLDLAVFDSLEDSDGE